MMREQGNDKHNISNWKQYNQALVNRGSEGLLSSVFMLMNVPLKSPTYTCISKCSKTVKVKIRLPSLGAVAHVVIDTTDLKVYSEGK